MNDDELRNATAIFVYGTLKRGELRERMWPRPAIRVVAAETLGTLYDLGAYPGLRPGKDRVRGELWFIAAADLEVTLRVLDGIEGYRGEPTDLYTRLTVACHSLPEGEVHEALTYHYHRPADLAGLAPLPANSAGFVEWSGGE